MGAKKVAIIPESNDSFSRKSVFSSCIIEEMLITILCRVKLLINKKIMFEKILAAKNTIISTRSQIKNLSKSAVGFSYDCAKTQKA